MRFDNSFSMSVREFNSLECADTFMQNEKFVASLWPELEPIPHHDENFAIFGVHRKRESINSSSDLDSFRRDFRQFVLSHICSSFQMTRRAILSQTGSRVIPEQGKTGFDEIRTF